MESEEKITKERRKKGEPSTSRTAASRTGQKDERFTFVADLVASGKCNTFLSLFKVVPKTVVAIAMGWNTRRFIKACENPLLFTYADVVCMAELMEISPRIIDLFIWDQVEAMAAATAQDNEELIAKIKEGQLQLQEGKGLDKEAARERIKHWL